MGRNRKLARTDNRVAVRYLALLIVTFVIGAMTLLEAHVNLVSSFFLNSNQSKSGTTHFKLASELGKNGSVNKYVEEEEEMVHGGQAVLCCIALDEESYIDEFVDYHIGIGFNKIIIYDNSNENQLKQWGQKRHNSTAEVIHYPGINMQGRAYLDCAKGAHYNGKMKWAAFWDVDEFLVLKKHDNVDRFLDEHLSSGALALNWYIFRQGGKTIYEPLPVTKRFVYRDNHTNAHVKSIVRLRDMDMTHRLHPHYPKLINGTQHDTNGKAFEGPFNAGGPSDIAVLHHYVTKSFQEYKNKRIRGRADTPNWNPSNPSPEYEQMVKSAIADYNNALARGQDQSELQQDDGNRQIPGVVDDSAWRIMKKVSPKYAFYDSFD